MPTAGREEVSFRGNARYQIVRRLGAGGCGIVYEAIDAQRDAHVALKTLKDLDPTALYRFKNEFRSLADTVHPNLVSLYELHSEGDEWFFTMELVAGTTFLHWVRPSTKDDVAFGETVPIERDSRPSSGSGSVPSVRRQDVGSADAPMQIATRLVRADLDLPRLRASLLQLAQAVNALHAGGKLHCDLKPSNVLVTNKGRLVVLDFGLVTELDARRARDPQLLGTVEYMAPEQAACTALSEATDWYAVGVMLYEALTARLPYVGHPLKLLYDKQTRDPPRPREVWSDVPPDLDALCTELLSRDATMRPRGDDVLRALGAVDTARSGQIPAISPRPSHTRLKIPFVGREPQLRALQEAFDHVCAGEAGDAGATNKPVIVHVHGSSGMGKSALVGHFLDELSRHDRAVVLTGRCYERESVPYKALDALVDALSSYLESLDRADVEVLLPRNVHALARVFPVLQRVEAIHETTKGAVDVKDAQELRRRAFGALRELFARIADRRPLVVCIDDLQWGDVDSAVLLAETFKPPDAPSMLFLACYRSEERSKSAFLQTLLPSLAASDADVRELAIGPLSAEAARTLALRLATQDAAADARLAESIARESDGSPLFIAELVQHAWALGLTGKDSLRGEMTLDRVLRAHFDRLPDEQRRLLTVVAVVGHPIREQHALAAANLEPDDRAAVDALRGGHLVRASHASVDRIEAFHDRIREALVAGLDGATSKKTHARLAEVLEASKEADAEILAVHFRGAGDTEKARRYARDAADRAAEALAFDRAARLYALAIELGGDGASDRHELERRLGDALANVGKSAEAAEHYLRAVARASDDTSLEMVQLRRSAAEQFLISGHIDRGLQVFRSVLDAVKLADPQTPARALMRLLFLRVWFALRGLGFTERPAAEISVRTLTRIDACWAAALGLGMVDNIRGAYFQARHLALALEAGEPYRVARALAMEVGYRATAGKAGASQTQRVSEVALALAQRIGNPHAVGLATVNSGLISYLQGFWRKGLERIQRGEEILRTRCNGVSWELDNALLFSLRCRLYLGGLRDVRGALPDLLDQARERGDLYATTYLHLRYGYLPHLADDDAAAARDRVVSALERWSQQAFHLQHYLDVFAQTEIDLYAGEGARAFARIEDNHARVRRSLLLRVQHLRVEWLHLHARAALCAAQQERDPRERARRLAIAKTAAKKLDREGAAWAAALAALVRAVVLQVRGDEAAAITAFGVAGERLDAADMALHAAAAKSRRATLASDDAEIAAAAAVMKAQTIAKPAQWTTMLLGASCR